MSDQLRQVVVLLLTLAQAIIGYFSNQWFDPNQGEISNSFENPFTPAGITFAVWGYLYIALIAYGIYQALPAQRERMIHRRIGWWVALACAASTLWPAVFSQVGLRGSPDFQIVPLWGSVLLIATLLVALSVVAQQLRYLYAEMTNADRWLAALPNLSYLAWASVATIANVTVLLIALGFDAGESGALWSTGMIIIATLIALAVIYRGSSRLGIFGFAAVILWALAGINVGNRDESALVGTTALVAMAVVALFYVWRFVMRPADAQPASHQPSSHSVAS